MPAPFTSPAPDICTSREAARQLKAAGFPQDATYFCRVGEKPVARQTLAYMGYYRADEEALAAPTTDELLRLLPTYVYVKLSSMGPNPFYIADIFPDHARVSDEAFRIAKKERTKEYDIAADALAPWYCHLAEAGLLTERPSIEYKADPDRLISALSRD